MKDAVSRSYPVMLSIFGSVHARVSNVHGASDRVT